MWILYVSKHPWNPFLSIGESKRAKSFKTFPLNLESSALLLSVDTEIPAKLFYENGRLTGGAAQSPHARPLIKMRGGDVSSMLTCDYLAYLLGEIKVQGRHARSLDWYPSRWHGVAPR